MHQRKKIKVLFEAEGQFPMSWQLELTPGQITRLKNAVQKSIEEVRGELLSSEV